MNKQLIISTVIVLLSACSSGSGEQDNGKYSLSGTVEGLSGTLTVSVNGTSEDITANGNYTLSTEIVNGESYQVSIVNSSDNLNCAITNESGSSNIDITNIDITCDASSFVAYDLNSLAISHELPSVITFAFHLVDRETNVAVTDITTANVKDYLYLTENDTKISASESFLEVDKAENLNVEFHTVFAIDISSSLSSSALETVVTNIKNTLVDSTTGESLLNPNQYISVYTFDSQVTAIVDKSQDTGDIITQLDQVSIGGNSTNLYGAIEASVAAIENDISLEQVKYGNLILFTDGTDTSGVVSKEQALEAAQNKDIYFIAVGDEASTIELESFTSPSNIFELTSFDELEQAVGDAFARMQTFEDGLYILSYATPKRAGTHTLKIEAIDDYRCDTAINEFEQSRINSQGMIEGCEDSHSYEFDAEGFTDVSTEILVLGPVITLSPTVEWKVKLRWTREVPSFSWVIENCYGDTSYQVSESGNQVIFTRNSNELGIIKVFVQDDVTSTQALRYLVLANTSGAYQLLSPTYIENACSFL